MESGAHQALREGSSSLWAGRLIAGIVDATAVSSRREVESGESILLPEVSIWRNLIYTLHFTYSDLFGYQGKLRGIQQVASLSERLWRNRSSDIR